MTRSGTLLSRNASWITSLYFLCCLCCTCKAKNEFEDRVNMVYSKVFNCLTGLSKRPTYTATLERHFEEVFRNTAQFRNIPLSEPPTPGRGDNRTGNTGKMVEYQFIDKFASMPFKYFNGLIPLFVQWSDYRSLGRKNNNGTYVPDHILFAPLMKIMRHDVVYVAVSSANVGLRMFRFIFPNVLILCATGEGHIPIPLVRGDMDFIAPPQEFKYDISFLGGKNHGKHRKSVLEGLEAALAKTKIKSLFGQRPDWIDVVAATAFNLAPLGYARQTFRYSEIVQIGRIPIYIYQDYPWLPYEGSKASPEAFSFVFRIDEVDKIVDTVRRTSYATILRKIEGVRAVRSLYTFRGLTGEMEKFFHDPLGPEGGYLKCRIPQDTSTLLDINLRH